MQSTSLIRRCGEQFRKGGTKELLRGARDYIKYDLWFDYQDSRTDNRARWEFVSTHIIDEDRMLIDIGCAEGNFAKEAAEIGLNVIGYDRNVKRLRTARRKYEEYDNLQFERVEFTPETISEIPEADIILFLTVHHHWVKAFGWAEAEEMFWTLLRKADTVVYEPPGNLTIGECNDWNHLDPEDSIEYYTELLESTFGDSIRIRDVMITDYEDATNRVDPIFVLDSLVS